MKLADLKKKTAEDLQKHAGKLRSGLAEIKREQLSSDDKNVMKIRNNKKELARTLTLIKEKQEEGK